MGNTVVFKFGVLLDRNFGIGVVIDGAETPWVRQWVVTSCEGLLRNVKHPEAVFAALARQMGHPEDDFVDEVMLAWSYYDNQILRDWWHGGCGPIRDLGVDPALGIDPGGDAITIEQLLDLTRRVELLAAARAAKKVHTRKRRSEFQRVRSDLVLAMLDAGHPYVCAVEGCGVSVNLTIDHKLALSRGGTDDLSNLQFMCGSHNSQKRDGPP